MGAKKKIVIDLQPYRTSSSPALLGVPLNFLPRGIDNLAAAMVKHRNRPAPDSSGELEEIFTLHLTPPVGAEPLKSIEIPQKKLDEMLEFSRKGGKGKSIVIDLMLMVDYDHQKLSSGAINEVTMAQLINGLVDHGIEINKLNLFICKFLPPVPTRRRATRALPFENFLNNVSLGPNATVALYNYVVNKDHANLPGRTLTTYNNAGLYRDQLPKKQQWDYKGYFYRKEGKWKEGDISVYTDNRKQRPIVDNERIVREELAERLTIEDWDNDGNATLSQAEPSNVKIKAADGPLSDKAVVYKSHEKIFLLDRLATVFEIPRDALVGIKFEDVKEHQRFDFHVDRTTINESTVREQTAMLNRNDPAWKEIDLNEEKSKALQEQLAAWRSRVELLRERIAKLPEDDEGLVAELEKIEAKLPTREKQPTELEALATSVAGIQGQATTYVTGHRGIMAKLHSELDFFESFSLEKQEQTVYGPLRKELTDLAKKQDEYLMKIARGCVHLQRLEKESPEVQEKSDRLHEASLALFDELGKNHDELRQLSIKRLLSDQDQTRLNELKIAGVVPENEPQELVSLEKQVQDFIVEQERKQIGRLQEQLSKFKQQWDQLEEATKNQQDSRDDSITQAINGWEQDYSTTGKRLAMLSEKWPVFNPKTFYVEEWRKNWEEQEEIRGKISSLIESLKKTAEMLKVDLKRDVESERDVEVEEIEIKQEMTADVQQKVKNSTQQEEAQERIPFQDQMSDQTQNMAQDQSQVQHLVEQQNPQQAQQQAQQQRRRTFLQRLLRQQRTGGNEQQQPLRALGRRVNNLARSFRRIFNVNLALIPEPSDGFRGKLQDGQTDLCTTTSFIEDPKKISSILQFFETALDSSSEKLKIEQQNVTQQFLETHEDQKSGLPAVSTSAADWLQQFRLDIEEAKLLIEEIEREDNRWAEEVKNSLLEEGMEALSEEELVEYKKLAWAVIQQEINDAKALLAVTEPNAQVIKSAADALIEELLAEGRQPPPPELQSEQDELEEKNRAPDANSRRAAQPSSPPSSNVTDTMTPLTATPPVIPRSKLDKQTRRAIDQYLPNVTNYSIERWDPRAHASRPGPFKINYKFELDGNVYGRLQEHNQGYVLIEIPGDCVPGKLPPLNTPIHFQSVENETRIQVSGSNQATVVDNFTILMVTDTTSTTGVGDIITRHEASTGIPCNGDDNVDREPDNSRERDDNQRPGGRHK